MIQVLPQFIYDVLLIKKDKNNTYFEKKNLKSIVELNVGEMI